MQPNSELLQLPVLHAPQKGSVIFINLQRSLSYIRGEDGRIYTSTDRLTIQELAEVSHRTNSDMPSVRFLPITGGGTHSACCVEVLNYNSDQSNVTPVPLKTHQNPTLHRLETVPGPSVSFISKISPSSEMAQIPFTTKSTVLTRPISSNVVSVSQNTNTLQPAITTVTWNKPVSENELDIIGRKAVVDLTEEELHLLLNYWYEIPEMFNKDSYPFPCEGFIVLSNSGSELMIFTRRLGCITVKEFPERKGQSYCYFMVCGPNDYRAMEFCQVQPPAFKSTKFVNSVNIETKGIALMSHGKRKDPESQWWAWNDQTGFMRCQTGSARTLMKKYSNWEPTAQMVMFDAHSSDNGRSWVIKTLSYIDYRNARQHNFFPQQAYFIDNLIVLPLARQRNTAEEIVFYSEKVQDEITASLIHVLEVPKRAGCRERYGAVIFATWGTDGFSRRYRALIAAPEEYWKPPRGNLAELAQILKVIHWDKKSPELENTSTVVKSEQPSANISAQRNTERYDNDESW